MEFRTKVELPAKGPKIQHTDRLMIWGSCFSEHIGNLLAEHKFSCDVNPFGVLYNPMSIATSIQCLLKKVLYREKDLREEQGIWYSLMHHSTFSSHKAEDCLQKINQRIAQGHEHLNQADWIIFTWGSSFVYTWKENGEIVGNCHKLPSRLFERKMVSVDEITAIYLPLLQELKAVRPNLQCLFTVSPIRHLKDGLHGNQLSKANLLIAIDQICRQMDFCHYFPSYEIMIDELRDYRFYADDMMHPSPLAIQYIWECFCNCYFTPSTLSFLKEWNKIRQGLAHRPFNPESEAYQTFLSQILLKIEDLKEKLPYLDVQKEIKLCQAQLKK